MISDSREGGVLAALCVGALVGAFTVAGWLFGFKLAGPQRSQYEYLYQQPAPPLHPDEPCIPVPCDPFAHGPIEVCCQLTEEDLEAEVYIGPAILYPSDDL